MCSGDESSNGNKPLRNAVTKKGTEREKRKSLERRARRFNFAFWPKVEGIEAGEGKKTKKGL